MGFAARCLDGARSGGGAVFEHDIDVGVQGGGGDEDGVLLVLAGVDAVGENVCVDIFADCGKIT